MYYYAFLFWLICIYISTMIKFGILWALIIYCGFSAIYAMLKDILTSK